VPLWDRAVSSALDSLAVRSPAAKRISGWTGTARSWTMPRGVGGNLSRSPAARILRSSQPSMPSVASHPLQGDGPDGRMRCPMLAAEPFSRSRWSMGRIRDRPW